MNKSWALNVFLLFISNASFTQQEIQGKIMDRNTQEPIPYANIGLEGSNVGTISNIDGSFSILVPEKYRKDTLNFSALGYSTKRIPLLLISSKKKLTIDLSEKTTWLETLIVETKREKNRIFEVGNKSFRGGVLETDTLYAGGSTALLIDPRLSSVELPVYLQKASLRIFKNNLDTLKFRIRLHAVDSVTGQPSDDLLQESRVAISTLRKGWLTFDLSQISYQITKPFFITFEQLLDVHDRKAIADGYRQFITKYPERLVIDTVEFEGKKVVRKRFIKGGLDLPGTFISIAPNKAKEFSCYVRETSFGEWTKVQGIVTATATLSNQPEPSPVVIKEQVFCEKPTKQGEAENISKEFMNETGMPGMQLFVSHKNKTQLSLSLGFADIKNQQIVTDSTRFRLNSISKSMTAIAMMQLMMQGKLDIDKTVQTYLPTFPSKKFPITVRQAASHTAGFRDYDEKNLSDYIRTEHYSTATQALSVFQEDSLLFEPGTQFFYSTFGWNLIGAVIESCSGVDYLSYMKREVWQPLGLTNTCGDEKNNVIPNRSKFYDITGEENDLGDLSYKYAGGGLLSTAKDLLVFGNALLSCKFFEDDRQLLFETNYLADGQATGYGLGWYIGKDANGHRMWYHSGDSFSSSSHLFIYPDDDLVIAFLGNSQEGVNFDTERIGELFYSK